MIIAISGTPGTGKTTLAKFLAKKLGLFHLQLRPYYKMISSGYDKKKGCYDLDYSKFKKLVLGKIKEHPEGLIVDTHISHLLPHGMVDLVVVLTCSNLKKLRQRLQKRKYPIVKVEENLQAEIFQVCLEETRERGHKILVFDTSKGLEKGKILRKVKLFFTNIPIKSSKSFSL